MTSKRDAMLSLLDGPPPYTPAAFFLHFPPEFKEGRASVEKHLEFFRYTGMDLVKIQYEQVFPLIPAIKQPADWAQMPRYDRDFFAGQLEAIAGLVEAAKSEAVIVVTLYSPFMCAGHTTSTETVVQHLNENPDAVKPGLEAITDSMLLFVRECIKLGVDGFYHSTQGGEGGRYSDPTTFERYVRPYDLALMEEINAACPFNILHVCDYLAPYTDFTPFLDYPGDVVSAPLHEGDQTLTPAQVSERFGRPFMGGLDRLGVLATGTPAEVTAAAEAVLADAPARFVFGADCTVPHNTPWENLKAAIDAAHAR